jgi:putative ABC transport system permease protein
MLRTNLLIAYRSLGKVKSTFVINLIGLSTGIASALLIYLWVSDELSVDKFHEHDSRLYQVMQNLGSNGSIGTVDVMPVPAARAIREEIPEIETATATVEDWVTEGVASVHDKRVKANGWFVTENFFDVFSFKIISGHRDKFLSEKHGVVISDELAFKLFNTNDGVVGKEFIWTRGDSTAYFQVSGVFEKPSTHSSARFDLVFPYEFFFGEKSHVADDWGGSASNLYAILKEGADVNDVGRKITTYLKQNGKDQTNDFFLQQYSDRYLHNQYKEGVAAGGRIVYVKLFSIIGILVLIVACINFMNLSTAKAVQRLKEVGVKKVVGANRSALVIQFLSESMLITSLSTVIAVVLVIASLPWFNEFTGKQLSYLFDGHVILFAIILTVFTGIFAGSYPAFYISGFKPVAILKGKIRASFGESFIRKGLVIVQFVVSVTFIIAVVIVYKQMEFIQKSDLGYSKEHVISMKADASMNTRLSGFLTELKKQRGIKDATNSASDLKGSHGGMSDVDWPGKKPGDHVSFGIMEVGSNYMDVLDFTMIEGRKFSPESNGERSKIIFNEAAIEAMGLKDPIGTMVWLDIWKEHKEIIGVVKDFHFESFYKEVKPAFFLVYPDGNNILIRIQPGMHQEAIKNIENLYSSFNPGLPLDYKFLDDEYQALYKSEQRVAVLSKWFAGIAVVISCLGLYGLASFSTERRSKEISIRKVLGATELGIVRLISIDFVKIVLVGIILAVPVSYVLSKNWLDSFAYKINLGWWYFVIPGVAALVIAFLTVSNQAIRAALTNPAECLKNE